MGELGKYAQYQVEPDQQGVESAILHATKGSERDVVLLVGVSEGLTPVSYVKTSVVREEGRRFPYVGIT